MANNWGKRLSVPYTCKSGNELTAHRPGPSLALKSQRFLPILQKPGMDNPAEQVAAILRLSDAELDELTDFARIIIADSVDSPVVSLTPREGQYHPDDLPIDDFWELFIWISRGCPSIPIKLKEGETDIETVSTFPSGQDEGDNAIEDGPAM